MKLKPEIEINSVNQRSFILKGKESEIHTLFEVRTLKKEEDVERKPIELAAVLDISGSMRGEKLKWSKRAIRKIIKHLTPADKLHFIVYDRNVEVIFEDGDLTDKETLVNLVRKIRDKTTTNLSGGLQRAHDILKKNKDVSFSKRIFLFSDGQANEGITSEKGLFKLSDRIRKDDIFISSFGIGNDFNEKVMTGIAEHAQGRYFFLEEQTITKQVSKAIHGLLSQSGTNSILRLTPVNDQICQIERIFGRESLTEFEVGDLFADNIQHILVKFKINVPSSSSCDVPFVFGQYDFSYDSREYQRNVTLRGDLSIDVTDDEDLIKEFESAQVTVSLKVKESSDTNKKVTTLISQRKYEEAKKIKEQMNQELAKFIELDETGKLKKILDKGEKELELLKQRNYDQGIKTIQYSQYQMDEDDDKGWESGDDSDEENWSEDEQEEDIEDDDDDDDSEDEDDFQDSEEESD